MAVPNILGGIQYGAPQQSFMNTAAGLQGMQANQQQMEMQQAQSRRDEKMRELASQYAQGDSSAVTEMFKVNPEMGMQFKKLENDRIQQYGSERNNLIKQNTIGFLQRVKEADPSEWSELAEEARQNPLIDFDDSRADALANGNKFVVDAGLVGMMGEKEYNAVYGQSGGAGSTPAQKDFEYYQNLQQRDPEAAREYGLAKGYVETGRDAMPTTTERDWKTYQRLKKENSEEARQYGQAAGFVSKEGRELSVAMQKRLSDATDSAIKASANSVKYDDLASQISTAGIEGGWGGRAEEALKEITGNQDFKSELRRDYYAIRGSEVVNNLPPGAASDADINMAKAGFPTDNASGEQIASFLRGLAKIQKYEKQLNEFKANYISDNGSERGMLEAWKSQDIQIQTPQRTIGKYQVSEG